MRRRLVLLCASLLLLPIAQALPPALLSYECGGRAPATTSCSTGEHTEVLALVGFSFGGFVGTVENRLVHEGGTQTRRCHADGDPGTGSYRTWCDERPEGPPPKPGGRFRHDCVSYDLGTRVLGGSGEWACWVRLVL